MMFLVECAKLNLSEGLSRVFRPAALLRIQPILPRLKDSSPYRILKPHKSGS
jgi:hypothetical protein